MWTNNPQCSLSYQWRPLHLQSHLRLSHNAIIGTDWIWPISRLGFSSSMLITMSSSSGSRPRLMPPSDEAHFEDNVRNLVRQSQMEEGDLQRRWQAMEHYWDQVAPPNHSACGLFPGILSRESELMTSRSPASEVSLSEWRQLSVAQRMQIVKDQSGEELPSLDDLSLTEKHIYGASASLLNHRPNHGHPTQAGKSGLSFRALRLPAPNLSVSHASNHSDRPGASGLPHPDPPSPATHAEPSLSEADSLKLALARSLDPREQVSDDMKEIFIAIKASRCCSNVQPKGDSHQYQRDMKRALADSRAQVTPRTAARERNGYHVDKTQVGRRPIVVDGNNVAFHHGKHSQFSPQGLKIVYEHFHKLGHDEITIFATRPKPLAPADEDTLKYLEGINVLHWVPYRKDRKHYDDMFVIEYAEAIKGIIISNDQFRDVAQDHPQYLNQIKERTLAYTIVRDTLILPSDPCGRGNPTTLTQFLSF